MVIAYCPQPHFYLASSRRGGTRHRNGYFSVRFGTIKLSKNKSLILLLFPFVRIPPFPNMRPFGGFSFEQQFIPLKFCCLLRWNIVLTLKAFNSKEILQNEQNLRGN